MKIKENNNNLNNINTNKYNEIGKSDEINRISFEIDYDFEINKNNKNQNIKLLFTDKMNNFLNLHKRELKLLRILFSYLITTILFIITLKLYIESLKECHLESDNLCLREYGLNFYVNLTFILFKSAFYGSILYFIFILRLVHYIYAIIVTLIFIYLFIKNQGDGLMKHGTYNMIGFIVTIILYVIIYEIIYKWLKCIFKKKYKPAIITFIIFLILFVIYIMLDFTTCKGWDKGIFSTYIKDNYEEDKCYMQRPTKCWNDKFDFLFDINSIMGSCKKKMKNERNILIQFKGKEYENTTYFAYPITTNYNLRNDSFLHNFQRKVIKEMYDLNKTNKDIKPEAILHFNEKNEGKLIIDVEPNQTLINERKKIQKIGKWDNVILIFIDALSRPHFLRKLKKTTKLIEKYYINNPKKDKKLNSFQFLKYQNFAGWTNPNYFPMFTGVTDDEKSENLINYYRRNGFITGQAANYCSREPFGIFDWNVDQIDSYNYDHEFFAIGCDPNYMDDRNRKDPFKGPYSIYKKCIYGRPSNEYIFEYGEKFLKAYIKQPKFLRLIFEDAHEPSQQVVKYLDEPLKNFLENVINNYWTEHTAIFVLSDHGNQMPSFHIITNSDFYNIERALGSLFIILPNATENEHMLYNIEGLKYNEQKLITPYDIYATLVKLLGNYDQEISQLGIPLDNPINGLERSCDNYPQFSYSENDSACFCKNYNKEIIK